MKQTYRVSVELGTTPAHCVSFTLRSGWPLNRVLADMRRQYRSYRSIEVSIVRSA